MKLLTAISLYIYIYIYIYSQIIFYFFSKRLEMRAAVANIFLDKFQLKPNELTILRGSREGSLHPVSILLLQTFKNIEKKKLLWYQNHILSS